MRRMSPSQVYDGLGDYTLATQYTIQHCLCYCFLCQLGYNGLQFSVVKQIKSVGRQTCACICYRNDKFSLPAPCQHVQIKLTIHEPVVDCAIFICIQDVQ